MTTWQAVCPLESIPVERGVCALVDGEQVALFRTSAGALYAVGNQDPFSKAMVLSRGIVGSRGQAATVASPMYKQVFDLATGVCLDEPAVRIATYDVQVRGGTVELALREQARRRA